MGLFGEIVDELRGMSIRQFVSQVLGLALIVSSAFMIWKCLILATGSESPVVVVLSGSMEPAFERGDILFLYNGEKEVGTGDIVVFNLPGRDIPIVHRVLRMHKKSGEFDEGQQIDILTKGDNNYNDDRVLYDPGVDWIHEENLLGRAVGYLPHAGMATIYMNDYPMIKFLLIGFLGLLVVTSKD
ncbi:signal peptidase [Chloropicon primus]|uniref:Signal peptidase complex catalytic subunit SEC11 n=1 Tax=Chloropicon primus TaxID=1764295 RepID=A0A5B8MV40_9CHLO|nr:signal peptidase [Chloropicon primus]UPR02717.1 signal peptidase [Chloropicon primus]|mmetsp:Transcript_3953/g.11488  ORF Transcript_3953/g.11488 Transcript_3953/m.11488 type:complete len:185 (-) Transcript_3953:71-625(-)|eukprot:QDZ23505.1 signal peptidase [Chloropicon primus]